MKNKEKKKYLRKYKDHRLIGELKSFLRSFKKVERETRETNRWILRKKLRVNESGPKLGYKILRRIVQDSGVCKRKPLKNNI